MQQDSVSDSLAKAGIAGVACAFISVFLNPLDVTKVRMQNQTNIAAHSRKYKSVIQSASLIFREEKVAGLMRGVTPSIFRELVYSSVRIGAYEPIRYTLHEGTGSKSSPVLKFLSALCSGFVGAFIANPFDLIKTRFQAVLPSERVLGVRPVTMVGAMSIIVKSKGVSGLYKGWEPTTLRAAVLTCAQVGSYDTIKNNVLVDIFKITDGFQLHILASLAAGLITTTVANPGNLFSLIHHVASSLGNYLFIYVLYLCLYTVDVVKTRYLVDAAQLYPTPFHCMVAVLRQDGIRGFFKVFTYIVLLVSMIICIFIYI